MDWPLYLLARAIIFCFGLLPLKLVAQVGRLLGTCAFVLDGRHRRTALLNLRKVYDERLTEQQIRALAMENFRRIGENYCCALKTALMPPEQVRNHCKVLGVDKFKARGGNNCIVAIGHFGNFELYTLLADGLSSWQGASTYRALKQPRLNALLQSLRQRSGCLFFERRTEASQLKQALAQGGILLGLLADQHAGRKGIVVPFLGQVSSTSAAPALLALRYKSPLFTAICYRVGLAQWQLEVGDEIPTHENGAPRAPEAIACDMNEAFAVAIARDPANWFWVHNRWKPLKKKAPTEVPES